MKYILIFIWFPFFAFSQTYSSDIFSVPDANNPMYTGNTVADTFRVYNSVRANNFRADLNMGVNLSGAAPSYTIDAGGTAAIRIPSGTTAQRPTAAAGVIRHNTDLNKFEGVGTGAVYYPFVQTLFSSTSNAVVSNTTAITSLASVSIPANSLAAGQTIRVNLEGFMSTLSPIPGKGRIGIVYGTDTIYTANDFLRAVTGNKTVIAEFTVRVSASGASGAVRAQGFFNQKTDNSDTQLFGGWFPITVPTTSNTTVDTTTTKTLSVFWQWATADINNSISITNAVIKRE